MKLHLKVVSTAALLACFVALPAPAFILVNTTVSPGSADYAAYDIVRVFAGFDAQTSPEAVLGAHGIRSVKITMSTRGPQPLAVGFTTPAGAQNMTTATIYGNGIDDATARTASASTDHLNFEAFGTAAGLRDPNGGSFHVFMLTVSQDGVTFLPIADPVNGIINPAPVNQSLFGALHGFRVEGYLEDPGRGLSL